MKRHRLVILLLITSALSARAHEPPAAVFAKLMDAMRGVKTCSFVLDINERIRGEMKHDEFVVKLQAKPYKVYVYSVTPNPGAEALLIDGWNNNKALVNPNHWLIPTLSLNPWGTTLRKNHQYTLWHFGFTYITEILEGNVKKHGNAFYSLLRHESDVTWNGRTYLQLVIENPDFGYRDYTVREGETLVEIGRKLMVNDYMILEANREVKSFTDVRAGQVIRVPVSFGKKIILYIDKRTFLPMVQVIYDDKGMYSRMEITSLIVNPVFNAGDFSKDNGKYGF